MSDDKTKGKEKEKVEYEDKSETLLKLSDKDLEILEVNKGDSNKETVSNFRKNFELPEVFKNTKKQELIKKLGLERDATQKQINTAMIENLEVAQINKAAAELKKSKAKK